MNALLLNDETQRYESLLKEACALGPTLEDREEETETLRQLPPATAADLRAAGLSRLCQPRKFGGAELPLHHAADIIAAVARSSASAAWICAVHNDHSIIATMFAGDVAEEIWGENPEAVISAGYHPAGSAEPIDGGWKLSGTWGWVSGCDFADWFLFGCLAETETFGVVPCLFLVPASETEIDDNWHVLGLRGTGSKNVSVRSAFVPGHRVLPFPLLNGGEELRRKEEARPLYRVSHVSSVPYFFNAVGLGIAESMLAIIVGQITRRESTGRRLATIQSLQLTVAEASAETDCARLLIMRDTSAVMEAMKAERSLTLQERARNRRDQAYAGTLCRRAVSRLQTIAGANAIFDHHAAQRKFRDLHAVTAHIIQSWDIAGATYGEVAFGLKPETVYL